MPHIDAVGIGVVLGAGGGVLQVIAAVVFGHERPFHIGLTDGEEDFGQRLAGHAGLGQHRGGHLDLAGFGVEERRQAAVDDAAFLIHHAVFTGAFIAKMFGVAGDQRPLFANGLQRFAVQLNAPDRLGVGAAPVEIEAAVVVEKEVGVPEREGRGHLLEFFMQRVGAAQNRAVLAAAGRTEIEVVPHLPHVRGIVVDHQVGIGTEAPAEQSSE